MTPPRLAERLLAASVRDEAWRDSILGDLREEYIVTRRHHGPGPARRWYWSQAFAIGARGVLARVGGRRPPVALLRSAELETRGGWRTGLLRDFRHAWRTLVRRPATSAVIIATLALALATNSTSYAILDALVLRPFRFPDLDRLVMIVSSDPQKGLLDRESVSAGDYRDWRREAQTLTHVSAAEWWDANLSGIENPEQVAGFKVTADFFDALGARPVIGRPFVIDEETPGNHRRAILGHALWSRLYGADPAIVGKTVRLDGEAYEVVGIAPPDFALPDGGQVWSPLAHSPEEWADRRNHFLQVVARLADGASIADARAELGRLAESQRRDYPDTNASLPNGVVPFLTGMRDPGAGPFVGTMQAASILLLLIACANIANLLLARGGERAQEFAMRLALGASRGRLAFQLMLEASFLSGIAIVLAIPLTWVGLGLSRASIPASVIRFIPGWRYMDISPTVFWSTAVFGAVATIVFALIPAWHSVRADVAESLKQGSRSTTAPRQRHWLRNSLAAAQVAITLALLFGSVLMLTASRSAVDGVFGFDKRNVLVARLALPERPYTDPERRRNFISGVLDRVRAIPAVASASMVSSLPYGGNNASREFWIEGVTLQPGEVRRVDYRRITPEYFGTMRIPVLAGRTLNDGDRLDTRAVAVVSQSVATRYWNAEDPIGRQFRLTQDGPPIIVVGMVGDVLHDWFQQRRAPTVYRPLAQEAPLGHAYVVRTIGDPMSVAGDLRRAVAAVDADQPIVALESMESLIVERTAGLTFVARALTVMALIALLLAVMGLYSLMAFMVSRRTQEFGVRLALGATRWQVIAPDDETRSTDYRRRVDCGRGRRSWIGTTDGVILYGVVATSAWQLAVLVVLIAAVSVGASYIPARRTAKLDPTVALRAE